MPITAELLKAQQDFRPIDAILLLGEPVKWERSLQLLIDVLMTNGDPRQKFKYMRDPHVPIIACNKDLTFKGAAALPRFGHGAFLECLQALYMVFILLCFANLFTLNPDISNQSYKTPENYQK